MESGTIGFTNMQESGYVLQGMCNRFLFVSHFSACASIFIQEPNFQQVLDLELPRSTNFCPIINRNRVGSEYFFLRSILIRLNVHTYTEKLSTNHLNLLINTCNEGFSVILSVFDVLLHLHFVKFAFCHGFRGQYPIIQYLTTGWLGGTQHFLE